MNGMILQEDNQIMGCVVGIGIWEEPLHFTIKAMSKKHRQTVSHKVASTLF